MNGLAPETLLGYLSFSLMLMGLKGVVIVITMGRKVLLSFYYVRVLLTRSAAHYLVFLHLGDLRSEGEPH